MFRYCGVGNGYMCQPYMVVLVGVCVSLIGCPGYYMCQPYMVVVVGSCVSHAWLSWLVHVSAMHGCPGWCFLVLVFLLPVESVINFRFSIY